MVEWQWRRQTKGRGWKTAILRKKCAVRSCTVPMCVVAEAYTSARVLHACVRMVCVCICVHVWWSCVRNDIANVECSRLYVMYVH